MSLYLNGRWHSRPLGAGEALPFGFRFGLGTFTTLGVRDGHPLFLALHLERLKAGAKLLNLCMPPIADLRRLIFEGIRRGRPNAGVVKIIIASAAENSENAAGSARVAVLVMPRRPVPEAVDLLLSPFVPTRWHAHKLTACMDSSIQAGRAKTAGCFDALTVASGELLDTSMANFFLVDRASISTPPAEGRILPGIARRQLLSAGEPGIIERRLDLRDLRGAVRLFLTNSVRGVIPVRRLAGPGGRVIWQVSGRPSAPETVLRAWERQMQRDLHHDL